MTSDQTTVAAAVPAARVAPEAAVAGTLPGRPFPLGATPVARACVAGTNFAIASSVAAGDRRQGREDLRVCQFVHRYARRRSAHFGHDWALS